MSAALPLLSLIGLLAVLALRQALHPDGPREADRVLVAVVWAEALVVLVLAMSQVLALVRP
jgi:hypothetical protein